jgi:hypothetical protein
LTIPQLRAAYRMATCFPPHTEESQDSITRSNVHVETNKYTCVKHVLSHIINYQYVSIVFAIIIRVALQELRTSTMSANKMRTLRHDYINVLIRKLLNVSRLTGPSSGTRHSVVFIIICNV